MITCRLVLPFERPSHTMLGDCHFSIALPTLCQDLQLDYHKETAQVAGSFPSPLELRHTVTPCSCVQVQGKNWGAPPSSRTHVDTEWRMFHPEIKQTIYNFHHTNFPSIYSIVCFVISTKKNVMGSPTNHAQMLNFTIKRLKTVKQFEPAK